MDRACLIFAAVFPIVFASLASADEASDDPASTNVITAAFTPVNTGRFTFFDDSDLAFEPNLWLASGAVVGYRRIVRENLSVGVSLRYLHTMTEYAGEYVQTGDGSDEGVEGYADIMRPGLDIAWVWSPEEENLDFKVGAVIGPSLIWFRDLSMAGLFGTVTASATLWLSSWLGLHAGLGLCVDGVWARSALGWARDDMGDSSAYTVFAHFDIGFDVRF